MGGRVPVHAKLSTDPSHSAFLCRREIDIPGVYVQFNF